MTRKLVNARIRTVSNSTQGQRTFTVFDEVVIDDSGNQIGPGTAVLMQQKEVIEDIGDGVYRIDGAEYSFVKDTPIEEAANE